MEIDLALVPVWIWVIFVFALGCSIGSFLNVVIWRLPRGMSLAHPPSSCPGCKERIKFYDNIPLVSWLVLGGKCRCCKSPISPRYIIIEFITGLVHVGVFAAYFVWGTRSALVGMEQFANGGWLIFLVHITLISALIAASAIDLELWIIPISICWFVTAVGIAGAATAGFVIDPEYIRANGLLPFAKGGVGAAAIGAGIGMIISNLLLMTGVIKPSYAQYNENETDLTMPQADDARYNHRVEVLREIVFLLPILVCGAGLYWAAKNNEAVRDLWGKLDSFAVFNGFAGALWGYFCGAGIVWATRILGTLGFGKEAMGLGDVHLMGAAGTIIGPGMAVVAFFIAPFVGLMWALYQLIFKKTRQIPYGPFLSLAICAVMIFADDISEYITHMMGY
ncbi:MAG: hypothetical protein A2Y07_04130 [Planctomycetes bacterium GWF2_50_10]|nr:MAG: hypothetical protein A2Y07_04130 [Planctomycetes bacterium GWF2_50_10]